MKFDKFTQDLSVAKFERYLKISDENEPCKQDK